jgi:hypothetical protein
LARRPRPCLSRGFSGSVVLYADHCTVHRVHRATPAKTVSSLGVCLHDQPSTGALRPSFILPKPLPSSEFLRRISRFRSEDQKLYLPGFRPSLRRHWERPLYARVPNSSLRSVLRLSQSLDGFLRAPASRACFIPKPHPGLACSGSFPFAQPDLPRRKAVPPRRCRAAPHRPKAMAGTTRLDLEALIRAKIRHYQLSVIRSGSRFPLQVLPPPGFEPSRCES